MIPFQRKCDGVYFTVNFQTTHTSGNHGQALAWAAHRAGIPCNVVTPKDTPHVKIEAIKGYGAEVTLCEPSPTSRLVDMCFTV